MRRCGVVSLIFLPLLLALRLSDAQPPSEPPPAAGMDEGGAWEPNFCDNDQLLAEAGLIRTALGQFIGFDCSADFFHCRKQGGGFRTYKKACGLGLVFDATGTQNCNYDYNVKGCGFADKYNEKPSLGEFHRLKTDTAGASQPPHPSAEQFETEQSEYENRGPPQRVVQQPIVPPPRQPIAVERPPQSRPKQPAPSAPLRVVKPAASSNRPLFPRLEPVEFIDKTQRIKPLATKHSFVTTPEFPAGAVIIEVTAPPRKVHQFIPPRPAAVPFRVPPQSSQPSPSPSPSAPTRSSHATPAASSKIRVPTQRELSTPTARPSPVTQSASRMSPTTTLEQIITTSQPTESTVRTSPRSSETKEPLPDTVLLQRSASTQTLQPIQPLLQPYQPLQPIRSLFEENVDRSAEITTSSETESSGESEDMRTLEPLAHEEYFTYDN
uniref:Chitin-binding type-2 domain-containing protein n=1 Tax=Plectus sambesii TaxID=2011161 RepID=A0A914W3S9_9BILA